nr:lysosomal acid phosphatase [Hymenolepis microstoma]
MLVHWIFALSFAQYIIISQTKSDSPLAVFLLARHGERYPCHYFNHPFYPEEYSNLRCQLTENGARQHYKLGQFIRNHYSNLFISKGFKQEEIHIRSTGTERTILSGTYFSLGLNSLSTSGLPHVLPVFSSPKQYDSLLKMSYPCPAFSKLFKALLDSNLSREFAQSELKLFDELKNFTDFEFDPAFPHFALKDLWKLCEPIYVWDGLERSTKGDSLPFSPDLAESCHRALSFRQQLRFSVPSQTFLRGGPLWDHILSTMRRLSTSAMSDDGFLADSEEIDILDIPIAPETRFLAYFAHDSTVAAFLSHVGMFNNILPPYASAVIVELHRMTDGQLGLKFFYHNSTEPSSANLVTLSSPLCTDEETGWCELNTLEQKLIGKAATDMVAACSEDKSSGRFKLAITTLAISFAFAYVLPIGFTVRALLCLISIFLTYRAIFFLS